VNFEHRTSKRPFDKPFDKLTVLSEVEGLTVLSEVEGLTVLSEVEGLTVLSEVEGLTVLSPSALLRTEGVRLEHFASALSLAPFAFPLLHKPKLLPQNCLLSLSPPYDR